MFQGLQMCCNSPCRTTMNMALSTSISVMSPFCAWRFPALRVAPAGLLGCLHYMVHMVR